MGSVPEPTGAVLTTTASSENSTQKSVRVAIADDHRLMLDGIRRALETAPDMTVVGEAMTGEEMLKLVPKVNPDVVILDMRMPKGDGLSTLEELKKDYPDLKVIILSMFEEPSHIEEALQKGASGYVVKSINPLDLPSTVRQVVEGTVYHPGFAGSGDGASPSPSAVASAEEPDDHGLTPKEKIILQHVAQGKSNLDIANEIFVTEQTVKFHLSNIYRKLGVANRTEATRFAFRNNMIND